MTNESPPPIKVAEAATRLGLTARHVRRLIRDGELRGWKVGRLIRLDPRDVQAFLDQLRGATP
jgi:excisionase family DNA binding protein